SELSIDIIFNPILVAIIFACLIMLLMNLAIRNWHKTALITTLTLLVFYFYQPLVLQLPHSLAHIGTFELTRGRVLLPIVVLAYSVSVFILIKRPVAWLPKATQPL